MTDTTPAQRIRDRYATAIAEAGGVIVRAGADGPAREELLVEFRHALNGALASAFLTALPEADRVAFLEAARQGSQASGAFVQAHATDALADAVCAGMGKFTETYSAEFSRHLAASAPSSSASV